MGSFQTTESQLVHLSGIIARVTDLNPPTEFSWLGGDLNSDLFIPNVML